MSMEVFTADTVNEVWRPVKDYEDIAEISSQGRLKNRKTGRVLQVKRWIMHYKEKYTTLVAAVEFRRAFPEFCEEEIKPEKKEKIKPSPFRLRNEEHEKLVLREWKNYNSVNSIGMEKRSSFVLFKQFSEYFFKKYPDLLAVASSELQ